MNSFSIDMKIISIEIESGSISIFGYIGESRHVAKLSFPSLDSLEHEAFGF